MPFALPSGKPLLDLLNGYQPTRPPVWMMRQAGRYLPEYRAVREKAGGFLELCYAPELAADVTLQPIRRFGFDAAILFADILVVPHALGQRVWFETGEGPRLEPVTDEAGLAALRDACDPVIVGHIAETVRRVKAELPAPVTFIGFCGAPFTVATYMVAGRGTPDQGPTRMLAYSNPLFFADLIQRIVTASVDYLSAQIEAGVDVVQIFDSWAGILPPEAFERWSLAPMAQIVRGVRARHPATPVIVFARGAETHIDAIIGATAAQGVGLGWSASPGAAVKANGGRAALQGNLDPLALLAGGSALDRGVDSVLEGFAGSRHVFNLGHGIVPQTPIAHVERMLELIRGRNLRDV